MEYALLALKTISSLSNRHNHSIQNLEDPFSIDPMAPTIPKTARAVVLDGPGAPWTIREVSVHMPGPGEVREPGEIPYQPCYEYCSSAGR